MPRNEREISRRQRDERGGQQHVPEGKYDSFRPVGMLEIEAIHQEPGGPENTDERGKPDRSTIATQQFVMKKERERPETNDRAHGEPSIRPHEFAIQRPQAGKFLLPPQAVRRLEACAQDAEMRDPGQPE